MADRKNDVLSTVEEDISATLVTMRRVQQKMIN